MKCGEAIVGDETGCILLTTRQQDKAEILTEGAYYALLNVYVPHSRLAIFVPSPPRGVSQMSYWAVQHGTRHHLGILVAHFWMIAVIFQKSFLLLFPQENATCSGDFLDRRR